MDVRDKRIDKFVGRCIGIFPNREKAEWGEGLTTERRGAMPLAETATGRGDRVSGMDS